MYVEVSVRFSTSCGMQPLTKRRGAVHEILNHKFLLVVRLKYHILGLFLLCEYVNQLLYILLA